MRPVLGVGLILVGVILAVYMGFWVCFIGGITDIIYQVRAPEVSMASVMFGVLKICFASAVGYVSGMVLVLPGYTLLHGK